MRLEMMDERYWAKIVSKFIKTEMAKRDISYQLLVEKLNDIGVEMSAQDLRTRLSRGTFGAILFIQLLRAMGVENLHLENSFFEESL
jgi:hypothetical protein